MDQLQRARHRARADEILLREVERAAPAARPLLHRRHRAWAEVMAVVLGAVHHVDVRETRGARLERLDEIAQHRRVQRLRLGHALGMVRARAVENVRDLGKPAALARASSASERSTATCRRAAGRLSGKPDDLPAAARQMDGEMAADQAVGAGDERYSFGHANDLRKPSAPSPAGRRRGRARAALRPPPRPGRRCRAAASSGLCRRT